MIISKSGTLVSLMDLEHEVKFNCVEICLKGEQLVLIPDDLHAPEDLQRAEEVILEALKREFGDD